MNIILKPKVRHYTKELTKLVIIMILGFLLILAIIFFKYEPVYEIKIAGNKIGYTKCENEFKDLIEDKITNQHEANVEDVTLVEEPSYELKLVARNIKSNTDETIDLLKDYTITTYKYYYVALNNENMGYTDTLEEAKAIVEEIKSCYSQEDLELNLQIFEKYTQNKDEVKTETLEETEKAIVAVADKEKEEKEKSSALAIINDVKLSVLPVNGRITSRYGEASSIRRSTHTGLDIACQTGTDIKVISSGIVTCAKKSGAYGNLVKIDHGQGIETWYGHCSKIYVKEGAKVEAGDIIAAVGSTGNSTGPHLHFEIRVDGNTVNPQNYVY